MIPKNARLRTRMLIDGECLSGHPASVDNVAWTREGWPVCRVCRRVTTKKERIKTEKPPPAEHDISVLVHEMLDVARRMDICRADERPDLQARYDMLQRLKDRLDSETRNRR